MEFRERSWSENEVRTLLRYAEQGTQLLRDLFDSVPYPIAVLDGELALSSYNHAFARAVSERHVSLRTFSILMQQAGQAPFARAGLSSPVSIKLALPLAISLTLELLRLPGNEERYIATIKDPDTQESTGNAAAHIVIENAPDPMYAYDANRRIIFANRLFESLSGYEITELNTMLVDLLIAQAGEGVQSAAGGLNIFRTAGYLITNANQKIPVDVSESAGTEDQSGMTVGVARVTSTRPQVADPQQVMDGLERMSGQIAHRFNNLLTIVLSYSDIIARRFSTVEALSRDVELITQAASSAAELTSHLLTFSGGRPARSECFNPTESVDNSRILLEQRLSPSFTLEIRKGKKDGLVAMHPSDFETILLNLVDNAAESYSAEGKIRIEVGQGLPVPNGESLISYSFGDYSDNAVIVSVTDSGRGMTQDILNRAFEPFFTTKSSKVGLGLSTVYGIVKSARGTIRVGSTVSEGTTVWISLPHAD